LNTPLPVTVTIDPDDPEPADVAGYFAEIAARFDEKPEPMRIRFEAPAGVAFDLDRKGNGIIVVPGRAPHVFSLRNRWIADHRVPLALDGALLEAVPTTGNRFRVSCAGAWARLCAKIAAHFQSERM